MIRFLLYICLIYQFFVSKDAEALAGEKVLPANPHEFPFIASVGFKIWNSLLGRDHICTGTLITKKHVLTAAHCFDNFTTSQVDVIIGDVDLRKANFTYGVDSWITYNDWALKRGKAKEYRTHDIAIVKLSSIVNRKNVKPVTLTNLKDQQLYGKEAVMAGWGTKEGEPVDVLQKTNVTTLTPEECASKLKLITTMLNISFDLLNNYLCTSADPYALATYGDRGAPLLDANNVLLGVTRGSCPNIKWRNFSPELISRFKVNMHLSVNYYREFIKDVAKI